MRPSRVKQGPSAPGMPFARGANLPFFGDSPSVILWIIPYNRARGTGYHMRMADDVALKIGRYILACARGDGGLNPNPCPAYRGRSDTSFSDIAAVSYALILEETLGFRVLNREKTLRFLNRCRGNDGLYHSIRRFKKTGETPYLRIYNTLQARLGMRIIGGNRVEPAGLGASVRAVARIYARGDYRKFPPYALDFLGQFYHVVKRPFPDRQARAVSREYLKRYRDGEVAGHVASTFHYVRHALLTGQPLPQSGEILRRTLALQRREGSFNNMPDPDWDVHATFDGCFIVRQLGARLGRRPAHARALRAAGRYALRCRNKDGGFGHFPGCRSDMDAVYFHAGTLVMAGMLPARHLPGDLAKVLGWGHVFPDEA